MASAPIKKLPGQKLEISSLLGLNFEREIEKESFSIQYRFRKVSIAYIFTKELGWTIAICLLFLFINYQYLICFNVQQFKIPFASIETLKSVLDPENEYWTDEHWNYDEFDPEIVPIVVELFD
jgi:hypothetical protein